MEDYSSLPLRSCTVCSPLKCTLVTLVNEYISYDANGVSYEVRLLMLKGIKLEAERHSTEVRKEFNSFKKELENAKED